MQKEAEKVESEDASLVPCCREKLFCLVSCFHVSKSSEQWLWDDTLGITEQGTPLFGKVLLVCK